MTDISAVIENTVVPVPGLEATVTSTNTLLAQVKGTFSSQDVVRYGAGVTMYVMV